MLSTESRRGRRILARLDRGTDLLDGVRTLCQRHDIRCGEIRGIGSLEMAELTALDQGSRRWKPARLVAGGGLELLQLHGNISEERGALSVKAQVTLMRDRDAGVEVIGGHLMSAVVYSVELVIETFDDVLLRRQADPDTGLSPWQEAIAEGGPAASPAPTAVAAPVATPPARPTTPAATAPRVTPSAAPAASHARPPAPAVAQPAQDASTGASAPAARPPASSPFSGASMSSATPTPTWADVAAASNPTRPVRPPDPEPQEEDFLLNAGDVILHPRFQRCVVHRVEGNGEFVQVMLRNGRVVRLSLEVLRLTPQGTENGQRIFTVTVL
jgi:predicted DNA-binding protein with PD1-like motif